VRPLTTAALLETWDVGSRQPPTRRPILLLAAATAGAEEALARLSVGERDGLLLDLREATFGARIEGVVECVHCLEPIELSFDLPDVRVTASLPAADALAVQGDDGPVRFRLPNSFDLAAVGEAGDVGAAPYQLLERCLLVGDGPSDAPRVSNLSTETIARIVGRMAACDPQANVELALECPACGHDWDAPFDVASFFWTEVDAWARRTLHDVHLLARAYGWSEQAILTMSTTRRRAYLDMVAG